MILPEQGLYVDSSLSFTTLYGLNFNAVSGDASSPHLNETGEQTNCFFKT